MKAYILKHRKKIKQALLWMSFSALMTVLAVLVISSANRSFREVMTDPPAVIDVTTEVDKRQSERQVELDKIQDDLKNTEKLREETHEKVERGTYEELEDLFIRLGF